MTPQKITTYLWFNGHAEEAAAFYTSVFPDSRIKEVSRWGDNMPFPKDVAMSVTFDLAGQGFIALNGGPQYTFTPAISLFVSCDTQEEVDTLWLKLLEGGGQAVACGWLQDRYGLSWQIIPKQLMRLMSDPDPRKAGAVGQAMLKMQKIDIAGLERAHAEA